MTFARLSTLFLLLVSLSAEAYIPPCSFMLKKMTQDRPTKHGALVYVSIYKPAETDKASDVLLGERALFFNQEAAPQEGEWPALSLLLESNGERLVHEVRNFGLRLPEEKDLVRVHHDQLISMKEMPSPFYQQEHDVSLHRFRKNGYVWACEEPTQKTALWIEKDTFVPALLRGPCPEGMGEGTCSVEFQNAWNLPEAKSARMVISKDDKIAYLVKVEHVIVNPSATQWKSAKEFAAKQVDASNALAPFFH
jgi:hypothetical protein